MGEVVLVTVAVGVLVRVAVKIVGVRLGKGETVKVDVGTSVPQRGTTVVGGVIRDGSVAVVCAVKVAEAGPVGEPGVSESARLGGTFCIKNHPPRRMIPMTIPPITRRIQIERRALLSGL